MRIRDRPVPLLANVYLMLADGPKKIKFNNAITNHDSVWVAAFMRRHLSPNRKAFDTQVEIRAHSTFDTDSTRNVFVAIITVI